MLKVVEKKPPPFSSERMLLTPELAMQMLEHNTLNRPLGDAHVKRIAHQIVMGRWRFNGDTIKISNDGKVLDGQHRLWACIEAKKPIETIVVHGVEPDAFSTIDTIRKSRTAADTIALLGTNRHRATIGGALTWIIRWQRDCIENYRQPKNKIENRDIEEAFVAHPSLEKAAERAIKIRRIGNPSIMAFLYYIVANRNNDIAERFMDALENPTGLSLSHPFYQFRAWMTTDTTKRKEPEHVIALAFKALNAVAAGRQIRLLKWTSQGKNAEAFPVLEI